MLNRCTFILIDEPTANYKRHVDLVTVEYEEKDPVRSVS